MNATGIFGRHMMGGGNTTAMLQILMLERIEPTSSNFMPIIEMPHRTKSWRNLGSETGPQPEGHFLCLSYYAPWVGVQPMFSNPRSLVQPKLSGI